MLINPLFDPQANKWFVTELPRYNGFDSIAKILQVLGPSYKVANYYPNGYDATADREVSSISVAASRSWMRTTYSAVSGSYKRVKAKPTPVAASATASLKIVSSDTKKSKSSPRKPSGPRPPRNPIPKQQAKENQNKVIVLINAGLSNREIMDRLQMTIGQVAGYRFRCQHKSLYKSYQDLPPNSETQGEPHA